MRNEIAISLMSEKEKEKAWEYRVEFSELSERYKGCSLETAQETAENKAILAVLRKYRDNASEMLKDGVGLYLHGKNGVGKTYLLACLCNDLMSNWYSCYFTSVVWLVDGLFTDKHGIFEKIEKTDFLFIDDLGKELLGREFDRAKCTWQQQKLFEVLDMRYASGKPVIFSSNYTLQQLLTELKADKAIVDRAIGLSSKIMELQGGSWRYEERHKKAVDLLG